MLQEQKQGGASSRLNRKEGVKCACSALNLVEEVSAQSLSLNPYHGKPSSDRKFENVPNGAVM